MRIPFLIWALHDWNGLDGSKYPSQRQWGYIVSWFVVNFGGWYSITDEHGDVTLLPPEWHEHGLSTDIRPGDSHGARGTQVWRL